MMQRYLLGLCGILLMLSATARADVALKNGNFFIAYTDLIYPGGFEPKVERIYNSKSSFLGIFGNGWGIEYEVYLSVSADGSVVVHEYGGGAENRFVPANFNAKELDAAIEMLAETARKVGLVSSADQLSAYKLKLKNNAVFRNDEWENFVKLKKLQPKKVANGVQFQSSKYSYQWITRIPTGYVRTFDSGKSEYFSDQGKLVKISDKNNNYIQLSYGKDGHLEKLQDNFNRKISFLFNRQGFLEKVTGENGKSAEYQYNGLAQLISSKDVDGNLYTFKYDKRHNMTEIGYSDKTTKQMSYYGPEKNDSIKTVKDRDGTVTEYAFNFADKSHYTVGVKIRGQDNKVLSDNSYEYFMKIKGDGEEWTQKMITTLDGEKTETVYDEKFGLPASIKRGPEETKFVYDNKGHVTKKTTPQEVTELTYDPKVNKIIKVVRYAPSAKAQQIWSQFQYDDKGNLVTAKNSDGKGVKLFYDNTGRIKSLVDQNKRQIHFKYNEHSKPIEITDPALGSISVSYTNSGEIKKVESSAGRKIALQVTAAFQNLLDIIKPAGVNLSF